MNEKIASKIELLAKNREVINKEFRFEMNLMSVVGALLFTSADKEADAETLKKCSQILKKNTSMFSSFRSTSEVSIICKLALAEDPEKYLLEIKDVYDRISKGRFFDSAYMVLGAASICDRGRFADADDIIARCKELMKRMSKEHPFLTSEEDFSFAVLLAMTGRSVDTIISDMEECYDYIKSKKLHIDSDAIQGLSEILALTDGDMKEKCDKVLEIYNAFADHKEKYSKGLEFPSLGALIDLDVDTETLVSEIIETANMIKEHKGFGNWSLDSKERLMYASFLVCDIYGKDSETLKDSVLKNTVAMAIAEEIAIIVVCALCASAAASANN